MKKPWELDPEDVMREIELEPKSHQHDMDVLIAVAKAASIIFDKETSLEQETPAAVKGHDRDLQAVNAVAKAARDKEQSMELVSTTAVKDHGREDLPVNADSMKDINGRLKNKRESGGRFDMKIVDQLHVLNISSVPGKNKEEKVSDKFSQLLILEGSSRDELLRRERLLKKPAMYQEEEKEREDYRRMKRESKRPSRFENTGTRGSSLKRDFGGRFDHLEIVDRLQGLDISIARKKIEGKVSGKSKLEASSSREELLRRERLLKKPMTFQKEEEERENHKRMMRESSKRPLRIEDFEEKEKRVGRKEKVDTKKAEKPKPRRPGLPNPPPGIPIEVMNRIQEMGGTDVKLVIQKKLEKTDCSPGHNRLSIPLNSLISKDFLDDSEKSYLEGRSDDGNLNNIPVVLIQPDTLEPVKILFRRWIMKKRNGRASYTYVLNKPWIDVVGWNGLQANDLIQLWSFRVNGNLCIALVRLPEIDPN